MPVGSVSADGNHHQDIDSSLKKPQLQPAENHSHHQHQEKDCFNSSSQPETDKEESNNVASSGDDGKVIPL